MGDAREEFEERMRAVAACVEGLVIELDADLRYTNVWVDDTLRASRTPEQMIGRTPVQVLGPEVGGPLEAMMRGVLATGEPLHDRLHVVFNGKGQWFITDMKRVRTNGAYSIIVVARDCTVWKKQEDALRRSEERYRLAEQATNDVLYDWDRITNEVLWGASARTVFRHADPVPDARWFFAQIHPDDRARLHQAGLDAIESGAESLSIGYRFRRGDGTWADLLDRCFIVRRDGKPIRVVGSLADVTERNRLQSQLVQADRLASLGLLAAGVGHEINNPLAYVLGNLDLALEAGPFAGSGAHAEEEDAREALREARDGAARIAEIVKGLKLFSRSDATVATDVQVEDVLERAVKVAENEIRHRARLVRRYQPTPRVRVSESRLGQVCLNLVVNAAQAMPPGAIAQNEICLATGVDADGAVFFSVSDSGAGIPPENIDHIFDPFFTTKPVGVGTGIGLSVCMEIVRSMGGTISVASTPGEATVFTVTLPAAERAVRAA